MTSLTRSSAWPPSAEQCRRLADATKDERTRTILLQIADESEQDMRRLEAERKKR